MDSDDLLPAKKAPQILLGEDISAFSAHELEQRIAALEAEIARCRLAISARLATKSAAENSSSVSYLSPALIFTAGIARSFVNR